MKNTRGEILASLTLDQKSEMINDMRDWIKDCQWEDVEESEIDEMSDEELIRGVEKHYDGGLYEFINANQY